MCIRDSSPTACRSVHRVQYLHTILLLYSANCIELSASQQPVKSIICYLCVKTRDTPVYHCFLWTTCTLVSSVITNRNWWHNIGCVDDDDWAKKCTEYETEDSIPRGRPRRSWREVVEKDCQACKLNKEDAMNCRRWKLIKDVRWSGWMRVGGCFFWYQPRE